jgi:hypothetical protein
MRKRKQGEKLRGRKESGSEEDDRGRRERASEEKDGEGERNPPPYYLSSLSCNIIIHLITSVFLPSPSSLLTLPHCLFPYFFCILFLITFSVYFSPPSSSSSSL